MKRAIAMMSAICCLATSADAQPLIGHWRFDEAPGATTAVDETGGTNGAIGSNVTLGVPGAAGTAFSLPGLTNDPTGIVDFENATSVIGPILARNNMTVSFWLNWTHNPVSRTVALSMNKDISSPGPFNVILDFINLGVTGSAPTAPQPPAFPDGRRFNTQGGVFGGINITPGGAVGGDEVVNTTGFNDNTGPFPMGGELVTAIPPGSGTALNDGQWHHVAMTVNTRTDILELFVDGVSVGQNPNPPIGPTGPPATTVGNPLGTQFDTFGTWMDFEVGALARDNAAAGGSQGHIAPYIGSIDEIQFYSRALTANEVGFLFQNPGDVVIPEPASLVLVGLGVSGLLLLGRQRRTLK
jgi:hypothetical protein